MIVFIFKLLFWGIIILIALGFLFQAFALLVGLFYKEKGDNVDKITQKGEQSISKFSERFGYGIGYVLGTIDNFIDSVLIKTFGENGLKTIKIILYVILFLSIGYIILFFLSAIITAIFNLDVDI